MACTANVPPCHSKASIHPRKKSGRCVSFKTLLQAMTDNRQQVQSAHKSLRTVGTTYFVEEIITL